MERPPSALYLDCPECGEETKHKVHKGRFEGKKKRVLKIVVECSECGDTREEEMRQDKDREVDLRISEGEHTSNSKILLPEGDELKLEGEIYTDQGIRTVIAAIEVDHRRVDRAFVKNIDTLWVKAREEVRVKVSINKGRTTISKDVIMHYDEEVSIGDMIEVDGKNAVVHKIKTNMATLNRGRARAEDIVRMYARLVRERWS